MACRIDIERAIREQVTSKLGGDLLNIEKSEFTDKVNNINKQYKEEIVSFEESGDQTNLVIGIPSKLVSVYQNYFENEDISKIKSLIDDDSIEIFKTNFEDLDSIIASYETDVSLPKIESLEDKTDDLINKLQDSLTIQIEEFSKYKKKNSKLEKGKLDKFEKKVKDIIANLEEERNLDKWSAIISFTKHMQSNLSSLKSRFNQEEFDEIDGLNIVKMYQNYISSYDYLDEINKLFSEVEFDKDKSITKENKELLRQLLDESNADHKKITSDFTAVTKNIVKKSLSDIKYHPEVETRWRNKLSKEYEFASSKNISKTEWIAKEMQTTYKNIISEDVERSVNSLINGIGFDISTATFLMNSSLNSNSRLIQIAQNLINDAKDSIITDIRDNDIKLKSAFDKFIKGKNSKKMSSLYSNIVEKIGDQYYLKENVSKLTKDEKEVIQIFKDITDTSNDNMFGISSLLTDIHGVTRYKLPSITKTDFERTLEGDLIGTIKDSWTDLTTIKTDDIGYEERSVRGNGSVIDHVPIYFRQNLDLETQSLDLFTVYRKEFFNGVNFKHKNKVEMSLNSLAEITKEKEFAVSSSGRIPVIGKLLGQSKVARLDGAQSNTYKKIKGLIDANVYGVLHKDAGKIAGIDANKAIGFVNKWTSAVGLTLNVGSATVNSLNGNFQLVLETVGGDSFKRKDLLKAHKSYLRDTADNIKDTYETVKKSRSNQLNQIFDTFGTIGVTDDAFIRNGITKSLLDPANGQILNKTGEHQMQSVMTMSVLNSIKVMNKDNKFIDKDGKVTDENKAASLLDMYKPNKDGFLELDNNVVYTTHTPVIEFNKGGKIQIQSLIKKRVFDTMGNYDAQMQSEVYRTGIGKLAMMYRKYLVPLGFKRFAGVSKAFVAKEKLRPEDKFYNHSLKDFEEGMYTTSLRFSKDVIFNLKKEGLKYIPSSWDKLTLKEKANIRRSTVELVTSNVILLLAVNIIKALADGDDDEYIMFAMYSLRRLDTELSQFSSINENLNLLKSPIPGSRILQSAAAVFGDFFNPLEQYDTGKRSGQYKIVVDFKKLVPLLSRTDITYKELYNYYNK